MSLISNEISGYMSKASFIRKMFERGIELKKQFGAENVYDFSLGNPDLPPPREVAAELRNIADDLDQAFALGYMPNPGYPETREATAQAISKDQGVDVPASSYRSLRVARLEPARVSGGYNNLSPRTFVSKYVRTYLLTYGQ